MDHLTAMITAMKYITVDVYPIAPENYVKGNKQLIEEMSNGLMLYFTKGSYGHGFFNTGFEAYLEGFRKRNNGEMLPPIWAYMHAIINNDRFIEKIFGKSNWECAPSSSMWHCDIKKNLIHIGHQVVNKPHYHVVLQKKHLVEVDTANYGMLFSFDADKCPKYTMGLNQLVNEYPEVARAVFLMDDDQLEILLRKCTSYSLEDKFLFGSNFYTSSPRPLCIHGRTSPHALSDEADVEYNFGITCLQFVGSSAPGLIIKPLSYQGS